MIDDTVLLGFTIDGYYDSYDLNLEVDVECVVPSSPGSFGPDGGEPPDGPEFEIVEVRVAEMTGTGGRSTRVITLTLDQLAVMFGDPFVEDLYRRVNDLATEPSRGYDDV